MALKEGIYKPDFPIKTGLSIKNPKGFNVGIKETDSEFLIVNQKGLVLGILDKTFFGMVSKGASPDDSPEVKRSRKNLASSRGKTQKETPKKTPKKTTAKTKKPTTKKGVKK